MTQRINQLCAKAWVAVKWTVRAQRFSCVWFVLNFCFMDGWMYVSSVLRLLQLMNQSPVFMQKIFTTQPKKAEGTEVLKKETWYQVSLGCSAFLPFYSPVSHPAWEARNRSVGRFQGVLRATERWWKTFAEKNLKKLMLTKKNKIKLLNSDAATCICDTFSF